MIDYILVLIIGCLFGFITASLLDKNSITEELEEAYRQGRADEKKRITNELKKMYNIEPNDMVGKL